MPERKDLNEYEWEGFFEELQDESPRAAVIISGAFPDGLLRDLLASFMVDDSKAANELLGTEKIQKSLWEPLVGESVQHIV